jgi:glucose-fructose oxidoreductase
MNLNQTRGIMTNMRFLLLFGAFVLSATTLSSGQTVPSQDGARLRVAIAGLVHGHAEGFLQANLHRADIELVGIAEPDQKVAAKYAAQFHIDTALMFTSLEQMLEKTHPQAVLAYTSTYDHRRVVEICARHGVAVMMEKPLAVSLEDALAIQQAAAKAKIPVLVNYETTWYRSNRAAYDLVHQNALGDVRKVVVHDGHRGPKEIGVQPEFLVWLTDPKLNGAGALFDFGCYGADLMTWLMDGRRPTAVTAVVQQIKPDVYPKVDDEATIILTYPHAQAIVQASWNWPFDRKDMEIYGKTGYAITVARDQLRVRRAGGDEEKVAAPPIPPPDDDPMNYLRAVVLGGVKPEGLSSLETNVTVMEILDAAQQSAATGKTVQLAPGK